MPIIDVIRSLLPESLLSWNRKRKKQIVRNALREQHQKGEGIDENQLADELSAMGIKEGDCVMVHSAMSKIGYMQNGPKTFVDAVLKIVGSSGTVCMPSSPVRLLQLDHIKQNNFFDVAKTPSAMGAITEYFRNLSETKRSCHPTEPVCANGRLADELIKDHFGQTTPYNENSPWKKIMDAGGKILYVGVTLDNAGTHLHTLEDAVDFRYPIYWKEELEVTCINENGEYLKMKTKVHNPEFSKRRKCDGLISLFEQEGVLSKHALGNANCLLLDAKKMFGTMVQAYHDRGITMYTPHGEKITGYDE